MQTHTRTHLHTLNNCPDKTKQHNVPALRLFPVKRAHFHILRSRRPRRQEVVSLFTELKRRVWCVFCVFSLVVGLEVACCEIHYDFISRSFELLQCSGIADFSHYHGLGAVCNRKRRYEGCLLSTIVCFRACRLMSQRTQSVCVCMYVNTVCFLYAGLL